MIHDNAFWTFVLSLWQDPKSFDVSNFTCFFLVNPHGALCVKALLTKWLMVCSKCWIIIAKILIVMMSITKLNEVDLVIKQQQPKQEQQQHKLVKLHPASLFYRFQVSLLPLDFLNIIYIWYNYTIFIFFFPTVMVYIGLHILIHNIIVSASILDI